MSRTVILESRPIQVRRRHYRIIGAATGQLEEGYVAVKKTFDRQPWLAIPPQPLRTAQVGNRARPAWRAGR